MALFHEAGEVRAAGLRAMRYLLRDEEAVESLCRVNLPLLICRSIDIVLDNRLERIQALRLVRQLLSLNPKKFPSAITHCLVSIAKDGIQERDMLVRACWATITELTVMNPTASATAGGLSAIIKSVLQSNQTHNISEALISSILFLLNSPKTRHYIHSDQDLQHFVAPFTDVHGFGGEYCDSHEQRVLRFIASKNAILSILRSWPGMIFMCRVSDNNKNIPNGIESLINMLYLPYTQIQRYIIEFIFELFYLIIPEWNEDFEVALISADPSSMQDSWHLYDGFVAAEGKSILPHITKHRLNLLTNYLALLLYSFINYGLIEALVAVIINSSDSCSSVTATVLLGELLHLSSCLLPSDCAHRCQSLPTLMAASTSSSPKKRNLANAAISNLNRIHELKKRGPIPCSLYLDQLLQFCQPTSAQNNLNNKSTKTKIRSNIRKNADEAVIQSIKNSQVLRREYNNWDFDLIDSIVKSPGDAFRKIDDTNHHKAFVKKLLNFYKPSSKLFSYVNSTDERARIMCIVGQHFLDFLLDVDEYKAHEYLEEFFVDLDNCLSQIAVETPPQNAILSPARLLSTLSHSYFLFIGRLTNSNKGKKWLEKTGLYQYLLDLISLSSHDVYMKIIVSSLDYSNEVNNFSRTLLTKVLTCVSESARLYATNYLRVLLRAGVCDFSKWAIELLVLQLYDKSSAVSLAAIDVLDEACDSVENLEALISLRPSLLHIGDSGLLLLIRYLSLQSGFKFLRDANFIDYELNRWQKSFNLKYVKIVEDVLNESFTCHQRNEDGTYGRRSDKKSGLPKNAFIPPHLYGQLAQTTDGYKLLLKEDCLAPHYAVIRSPDLDSDLGIIKLKAALWAVGHVGATSLGFQLILETEMIPLIIQMVSQSPILSVRGTSYFVLGLLATTLEGSEALKEFGWEAIRHSHHEKFSLVEEPITDSLRNYFNENRAHTWSMSSNSNKFCDMFDVLSGKDFESSPNELFVTLDFRPLEEPTYSGSMPSLNFESDKTKTKKISLPSTKSPKLKMLPRVSSLSPHHYKTLIDSRPRSSSDCQTVQKSTERKISNNIDADESDCSSGIWIGQRSNESVIQSAVSSTDIDNSQDSTITLKPERHDSGLIADALFAQPMPVMQTTPKTSTLTVQETSKRKISESSNAFYGSFPRDERSDSNESSHNSSGKSRSGSLADSTSGVSAGSCDSASQTLNISLRMRNNLSPIASLSSISNSTQSSALKSPLSPAISGNTSLPRIGSKNFLANQTGQEVMNVSAIDAYGYATLRAIQKRRVQSLSGGIELNGHDSKEDNDEVSQETRETALNSDVSMRKNSVFDSEERSVSPENEEKKFMGLCLPINLVFIFAIEASFVNLFSNLCSFL